MTQRLFVSPSVSVYLCVCVRESSFAFARDCNVQFRKWGLTDETCGVPYLTARKLGHSYVCPDGGEHQFLTVACHSPSTSASTCCFTTTKCVELAMSGLISVTCLLREGPRLVSRGSIVNSATGRGSLCVKISVLH